VIYEEALDILYGQNQLIVNVVDDRDLNYIKTLSPKTVALIRSLYITFDPEPYTIDTICKALSQFWKFCRFIRDKILPSLVTVTYHAKLCQWNAHHTRKLLEPISILPSLKAFRCQFWWPGVECQNSINERKTFRSLCQQAVGGKQGTMFVKQKDIFPFSKLPLELQDMVLQHSDLVSKSRNGVQDLISSPRRWNRNFCCGYCTDSNEPCRCSHEGRYSTTCECHPSESRLFAVAHYMRRQVENIYYTHNEFKFGGNSVQELSSEIFRIPAPIIRRLHHIHLQFWPVEDNLWGDYKEWTD
jgi:hypothetical protein